MFDLVKFIDEKWKWSKQTFGTGRRTAGISAHIVKELDEIKLQPTDLEEWVDVMLLAFDGASRAGYSGEEIVVALITKQMKNVMRNWPTSSEQLADHLPVEHIRDEDEFGDRVRRYIRDNLEDDPNSASGKRIK